VQTDRKNCFDGTCCLQHRSLRNVRVSTAIRPLVNVCWRNDVASQITVGSCPVLTAVTVSWRHAEMWRHEPVCDNRCLVQPNCRVLSNAKVHYPVFCSMLMVSILSHTVPPPPIILYNIHFNIILRSTPLYWKSSPSLRILYQDFICVSYLSYACYMSASSDGP
jgi:hypothetical protein